MGLNTKCLIHGNSHPDAFCICERNVRLYLVYIELIRNILDNEKGEITMRELGEKLIRKEEFLKIQERLDSALNHVDSCPECFIYLISNSIQNFGDLLKSRVKN